MKNKTIKQLEIEIKRLKFENKYKDSQIDSLISNQSDSHKQINQIRNIQEDYIEAFKHTRNMELVRAEKELQKAKAKTELNKVIPELVKFGQEIFMSFLKPKEK